MLPKGFPSQGTTCRERRCSLPSFGPRRVALCTRPKSAAARNSGSFDPPSRRGSCTLRNGITPPRVIARECADIRVDNRNTSIRGDTSPMYMYVRVRAPRATDLDTSTNKFIYILPLLAFIRKLVMNRVVLEGLSQVTRLIRLENF